MDTRVSSEDSSNQVDPLEASSVDSSPVTQGQVRPMTLPATGPDPTEAFLLLLSEEQRNLYAAHRIFKTSRNSSRAVSPPNNQPMPRAPVVSTAYAPPIVAQPQPNTFQTLMAASHRQQQSELGVASNTVAFMTPTNHINRPNPPQTLLTASTFLDRISADIDNSQGNPPALIPQQVSSVTGTIRLASGDVLRRQSQLFQPVLQLTPPDTSPAAIPLPNPHPSVAAAPPASNPLIPPTSLPPAFAVLPPPIPTTPLAPVGHPTRRGSQDGALPAPPSRRSSSMFERQLRQSADQSTTSITFKQEPPHDIFLRNLRIDTILRFIDDIIEYHERHSIQLKVGALISRGVLQEMCARYANLSLHALIAASTVDIFNILLAEITPTTQYEFYQRLEAAVHFVLAAHHPTTYRPSPADYRPMYNGLLTYKKVFLRIVEIFSYTLLDIAPQNIPECSTKRGGLVKLVLDEIPFEYGNRVHQAYLTKLMTPDLTFHAYLNLFFKVIEHHFSLYVQFRTFAQHFGGSAYHAGNTMPRRNQVSSSRPSGPPRREPSGPLRRDQYPRRSPLPSQHRVQAVLQPSDETALVP